MTLRLRTLGCAALERDGVRLAGRATQRRRLALLLLLAAGRDRGVSRDKLLAYLWPALDAEHGRASLSQTVYWLRRELGNEAIVGGIDDLSLGAAALTTDLAEFEDAIAAERFDRAVELYGDRSEMASSSAGLPSSSTGSTSSASGLRSRGQEPWRRSPPKPTTAATMRVRRATGGRWWLRTHSTPGSRSVS